MMFIQHSTMSIVEFEMNGERYDASEFFLPNCRIVLTAFYFENLRKLCDLFWNKRASNAKTFHCFKQSVNSNLLCIYYTNYKKKVPNQQNKDFLLLLLLQHKNCTVYKTVFTLLLCWVKLNAVKLTIVTQKQWDKTLNNCIFINLTTEYTKNKENNSIWMKSLEIVEIATKNI